MKLPNKEKAIISPEKLHDYLLSPLHPVGRFKAEFFRSLGYSSKNWMDLEVTIQAILDNSAEKKIKTEYGQEYEVRGKITGPSNKTAEIITAWIILDGEDFPKFITAYPGD